MRSTQRFLRARSLPKFGALAASVVASLTYPWTVGPKPAVADPVGHQVADPPLSDPVAIGVRLANVEVTLAQSQDEVDAATADLRRQAVSSFVEGGSARVDDSLFQGQGGYEGAVRKAYLGMLTSDAQDAVRRLASARADLRADQARLQNELQLAQASMARALSAPGAAVAVSDSGTAPSLNIKTPGDFANALLRTLGDPVSPGSVDAIVAWCKAEGGAWNSPAKFNPLNTSMRMPGSHSINGSGVQSYNSWSQGLTATVATLNSGAYRGILAALKAGGGVGAVERAVSSSPWGTHF